MLDSNSEQIIQRLQKIDDAINSVGVESTKTSNIQRFLVKESLLDALLTLYDECNNETLKRNINVAKFVDKYRPVIHELRQLRVNLNDFEQKKVIGRGHFGVVQVVREKLTGNVYALKILQKSETLAQQHVAFYEEERDIMAKATSPWITHLQYAFQDNRNLYILMDFHPGGDLLSLLDRFNYVFSEDMTRFYLSEITVAIHALHTMGYVHRDIKPDNILIDRLGHIKLADFGSAAKLTLSKCVRSEMAVGTPDYIAPELLISMNKTHNNETSYGVECDFWSLGIMAYEMLYGETPFKGENSLTTYNNIINHENALRFQDSEENVVSEDAKLLIKGLLSSAQQRFCYNKIVSHKFFLHTDWNNLEAVQPPFIPVVTSVDDTSNFEEFDYKESSSLNIEEFRTKQPFSGFQLPFVGFTYSRPLHSSNKNESQAYSTSISSSKDTIHLEVELKSKKRELHEAHMKIRRLSENGQGKGSLSEVEKRALIAEKKVSLMDEEVKNSRTKTVDYINKIEKLKETLKSEKASQAEREAKALAYMKEIKEKWKRNEEEKLKHLAEKVEIYQKSAEVLNEHKNEAEKQLRDMTLEANKLEEEVLKYKQLYKEKVKELGKMVSERLLADSQEVSNSDVNNSTILHKTCADDLDQEKKKVCLLENQISTLGHEVSSLREDNNSFKARMEELENEKKIFESEICTLKKTLKTTKDDCEALEAELKETKETAIRDRDLILHELEVKLIHEQRECYELRIKLQELSQSLNESLATQDSVVSHQESLEAQLKSTKEELDVVAREKENALLELSIVSSREDELHLKIKDLESLLESLKTTLNKLELKQTIDENKETHQRSEAQVELLQKQLQNTQESASADKEKLHLTESNLIKLGKEVSDVKFDLRSCQRELKKVQETNSYLRERVKELKAQLTEKENEVSQLNLKKIEIEEILKGKDVEFLLISRKYEETQSDTKRLSKKIEESEKEKDEIKAKVDELRSKIILCQSEADKMKIEKRGFENQLKLLEREQEVERKRFIDKETELNKSVQDLETKLTNVQTIVGSLGEVCCEQDNQLSVIDKFEEKLSSLSNEKQTLSGEIQKLQTDLKLSKTSFNEEKSLRIFQEKRVKDLESKLTAIEQEMDDQKLNLEDELKIIKEENNILVSQVSELERKIAELQVKERSFEFAQLDKENQIELMKDDISGHIAYIHSLKESNFKLTEGLDEAIAKGESYKTRIEEQEKRLRDSKAVFDDKELKLNSTVSQQAKLIDFLQAKVENPPKKKATLSRMFGGQQKNKENSGFMVGHQYRKLEDLLAREKEHSKQLAFQLTKVQNENLTLKNHASSASHGVMEDLTNSPSFHENQPRERMRHKIPHRWQSHLVVRPGRCAGCLGSVPFSRNAVKCDDCGVIAHTKCSKNIANTCGLPDGFAHHYSKTLSLAKSDSGDRSNQDSTKILMKGWIRIPRCGKATWEKRYACLYEKELCCYDQKPVPSLQPVIKYNLDTKNSRIAILHSVAMSELPSCNVSDLPYVLKIDIREEKQTVTTPVYIMTTSFEDKQLWISALEGVIHAHDSKDDAKGSLETNTLLALNSVTSLDINTVVFLNNRIALVGAVEGLFSFTYDDDKKLNFKARIEGISSVFEILLIQCIGVAVIIGGKENFLYHTNLELLKVAAEASQMAKPSIKLCNIEPQIPCHLVSSSQHTKRVFICAAAENRISIFWWCTEKQTFEVCRQYSTQEPCSCFQFTPTSLIVGAERFYKINLKNFDIDEYLDETDTSLAYAIYGSAQMSSFPVAIIQVSGTGKHEEYLLVFYEFGIFVDSEGRRTREYDLKFVRLPVAIVFCPPYLYILHHNSVEVLEIKPESFTKVKGISFDSESECAPSIRSASKLLTKPRFIGNSLDMKSILLATSVEDHYEVISLRADFSDDLDSSLSWSMNTSFQASQYGLETASLNSETSFGSSATNESSSTSSTLKRSKFPNFMRASKRSKKANAN